MKILITGAHGDIGQSVYKILIKCFKKSVIHGMDILNEGPGNLVFKKVIKSFRPNHKKFSNHFGKIAKKYDLIIPTTEQEMFFFSKEKKFIKNFPILINNPKIVIKFLDKYETFKYLKKKKFYHPRFCYLLSSNEKIKIPFFLKKRSGSGNQNYKVINSKEELKYLKSLNKKEWIVQEFLNKGKEYTCALVKLGNFSSSLIMERKLFKDKTYYAKIVKNKKLEKTLKKIAYDIGLYGCINVQLKIYKNKITIFEINPRLSSTVLMRHILGFKDCEWWVKDYLGIKTYKKNISKVGSKIIRVSEERIIN